MIPKRTFDAVIVGATRAGSSACRAAGGVTGRESAPAADTHLCLLER
jgi:flavin-dependent dehydrogenase